jgi:hypothetical protein
MWSLAITLLLIERKGRRGLYDRRKSCTSITEDTSMIFLPSAFLLRSLRREFTQILLVQYNYNLCIAIPAFGNACSLLL